MIVENARDPEEDDPVHDRLDARVRRRPVGARAGRRRWWRP